MDKTTAMLTGHVLGLQVLLTGMLRALIRTSEDRQALERTLRQLFEEMEQDQELRATFLNAATRRGFLSVKNDMLKFVHTMPHPEESNPQ